MFGTSGIRGVFGKDVTPDLFCKVGSAFAPRCSELVISRDTRESGVCLEDAFAEGALSSGASVLRLGVAPTPMLSYATMVRKCRGAMITASHNPPEYNGVKLFENGREFSKAGEKILEKNLSPASGAGSVSGSDHCLDGVLEEFISFAVSNVDVGLISSKAPRVLVDCGNGAGSVVTPFALRRAGCRVLGFNSSPHGVFPRGLEPNEENLARTAKLVKTVKADFAVAHDGDADRAIAIDEKGRVLHLDTQLAIFCKYFLEKKKGEVVSTVEASLSVRECVENAGGKLLITPVGSREVSEEVRRRKAVFGGEPCGEYIFPGKLETADGIRAALYLAEIFCAKGALSKLADAFPRYPIRREKFACSDKQGAMKKINSELPSCGIKGKLNSLDGLRFDFEDGWLLVRPSGTEPFIRVTGECKRERELDKVFETVVPIVKRAIGG